MPVIGPLGPGGKPRHAQADLAEERTPVHRVECILEIDFYQHLGAMAGIAVCPLPGNMDSRLAAKRGVHTNCLRMQIRGP